MRRVQIRSDVADWIAEALRESQGDKERFHRSSVMHLQRQYLAVQAKLDRAYDDRLAGRITDELWLRKSGEWEGELASIRRETAKHEKASHDYEATGSKILELATNAHNLFVLQDSHAHRGPEADQTSSVILGFVGFVRNIARIVGPSPVGGGPFVRNLSSFPRNAETR